MIAVIGPPEREEHKFYAPLTFSMYTVFIDEIPSVELVAKAKRFRNSIHASLAPGVKPRDETEAIKFLDKVIEYCKFSGVPVDEGVEE